MMNEAISYLKTVSPDDFTRRAMYVINLAEYYKDNKEPEKAREVLEEMGKWVGKVGFNGLEDKEVTDIAARICERIRKADIPNEKNPNGHRVTLSVGVANVRISGQTDTIIEIANYADKAVYYSKNAGKNCIHLLDHGRKDAVGNEARFIRIDF